MDFYAHGYVPIAKRYTASTAARTAIWTPAASARIILTDLAVSTSMSTTFRVEFGSSNGYIIMDHWCQGSVMVYPITGGIVDSNQGSNMGMDCPLVISFGPGLSASTENNYVFAAGAEDRS